MRRLGLILITALGLASCSGVTIDEPTQVPQGQVAVNLLQDNMTKAAEELPVLDDFIVEIEETATDRLFYRKTYADAQGANILLNEGEHRLYAYYGDPQKAGFKACYYVADTLFNVKAHELVQVDAIARIGNVKVAVNFGQTLNLDYDQYYAEVVAANGAKLTFVKSEKRAGYAPVGEISLNLYVYVQDKWMVYKTAPVTCHARDFVTFNVDTQRLGDLSVEILIDNGADTVVKEVEVPAEAAPTEAPTLTISGFEGEKLSIVEAAPKQYKGYKADIVAMGGINSCVLNIKSSYLSSKGIPSSVDLASADETVLAALEAVGLKFLRGMDGTRLSYVDFSGLVNYITQNTAYRPDYESSIVDFSLTVTDKAGKTASTPVYTIAIDKSQAEVIFNDYNVWATQLKGVVLNVTKGDPSKYVLKCVKASDMLYTSVQTIQPQSVTGNKVTFGAFSGMTAGTGYKVWAVYNGNSYNKTSEHPFTTENAQQVGNNGFESFTVNTFSGTHPTKWFDLWASGDSSPWWATNSSVTLDKTSTEWYPNLKSFPTVNMTSQSPHSGSYCITVASIAVADASSELNVFNSWGDAQTGEVFIGRADNSGEHKGGHTEDGHVFTSRPSSMSYWYKLDSYESDPYYVEVQVLDASGEVIGSAKKTDMSTSVSSWTQVTLPISYDITNSKAAKIYILFKSSATGKTSSRKFTLSRYVTSEGTVTVHAGNVLWLDDVKLNY